MLYRNRGFALSDLIVFVLTLAMVAIAISPKLVRSDTQEKAEELIYQLGNLENSIQRYCDTANQYPPNTVPGIDPGLFRNVSNEPNWQGPYIRRGQVRLDRTPIGGTWDWENYEGQPSVDDSISVIGFAVLESGSSNPKLDDEAALVVDQMLDDGDPKSGRWRKMESQKGYRYLLVPDTACLLARGNAQ